MPVNVIDSHQQFRDVINSGKVVVIDFWAEWCGPCKFISPFLEEHSSAPENAAIEFYKVNVDSQPEIAEEAGIRAMPTFKVFKDGNRVDELVGANQVGLQTLIRNALTK